MYGLESRPAEFNEPGGRQCPFLRDRRQQDNAEDSSWYHVNLFYDRLLDESRFRWDKRSNVCANVDNSRVPAPGNLSPWRRFLFTIETGLGCVTEIKGERDSPSCAVFRRMEARAVSLFIFITHGSHSKYLPAYVMLRERISESVFYRFRGKFTFLTYECVCFLSYASYEYCTFR